MQNLCGFLIYINIVLGLPFGSAGKEPACQCRRHWRRWVWSLVRKIPWRRKWANHCSILAWRILWTEEPGGLQSMGSQIIKHDWVCTHKNVLNLTAACSFSHSTVIFFDSSMLPVSESRSVMSDSLRSHGLYSPWNSLGQNTGVGSLSLFQGSSEPRDRTQISRVAGEFFTSWVQQASKLSDDVVKIEIAEFQSKRFLFKRP